MSFVVFGLRVAKVCGRQNLSENALGVVKYFLIPKSDNGVLVQREIRASLGVMGGYIGVVMHAAINFDYQFAGRAIKVQNERFDRMLKAKAQTADLPVLQTIP